jgi:hypothetical protein
VIVSYGGVFDWESRVFNEHLFTVILLSYLLLVICLKWRPLLMGGVFVIGISIYIYISFETNWFIIIIVIVTSYGGCYEVNG